MTITAVCLKSRIDSTQDDQKKRSSHKYAVDVLVGALNLSDTDDISLLITDELSSTVEEVKSHLRDTLHLSQKRVSNIISDVRNQLALYADLNSVRSNFKVVYKEYREKLNQDSKPPIDHIKAIYDEVKSSGIKRSYVKSSVLGKFSRSKNYPISDDLLIVLTAIDTRFKMQGRLKNAYKEYINKHRSERRIGVSIRLSDYVNDLSEKQTRKAISNRASISLRGNSASSVYLKNYFNDVSDLTDQFTTAIKEINSYKTTGIVAGKSAKLTKRQRWKTTGLIPEKSSKATVLNLFGREHKKCRSGINFWEGIGCFFSFQAMPKLPDRNLFKGEAKTHLTEEEIDFILPSYSGLEIPRTDINFFSLLNGSLIYNFYESCVSSNTKSKFLNFVKYLNALLNDHYSYFLISKTARRESTRYLKSISEIDDESELLAYITELKSSLEDMKTTMESDFKDKSEAFDNISFILEREYPLSFLTDVYKLAKKRYVNDLSIQFKLIHYRDLLITHLEMYNPLRVSSLQALTVPRKNGTLRPLKKLSVVDNERQIRKEPSYQIVLDKNNFKNIRTAQDDDYEANFPIAVEEDLHAYLDVRERYLELHRVDSDFLFIPTKTTMTYNPIIGMNENSLTEAFKKFVTSYRPPGEYGYRPFGLHANRHIVATNYLRENPEHYVVVAEILHDTIETVLKTYAHLSTSRGLNNQGLLVQKLMSENPRMAG